MFFNIDNKLLVGVEVKTWVFFFLKKENMGCSLGFKFRIFYNRLLV